MTDGYSSSFYDNKSNQQVLNSTPLSLFISAFPAFSLPCNSHYSLIFRSLFLSLIAITVGAQSILCPVHACSATADWSNRPFLA